MKDILKVTLVIIGTIIGAGFASRKRNIFIFRNIWSKWSNRDNNSSSFGRINNI